MIEIWQRIEAVLRATAPELCDLSDGASVGEIAAVEARLGFALPTDIRESYAVHNGSGGACILPQYYADQVNGVNLLSLEEAECDRGIWIDLLDGGAFEGNEARPEGPVKAEWWNRRWLPITSDGGGNSLCIDLDPAPGGTVGQVIDHDHETGPSVVVANSFRAFLEGYAADLETGRLRFDSRGQLVVAERP